MLTDAIRRYFLRIYAAELARPPDRQAHWGAFGEATFQTVLLVVLPIIGVGAAAGVLLLETNLHAFLMEHRPVVTASFAVAPGALACLVVRHLVSEYRDQPQAAALHSSARERARSHWQFWCVLALSLAIPWIAALGVRLVR